MKASILLVDDDPHGLESARKILELSGYAVCTATNGEEALAWLRREVFDAVVSDVRMPQMNGLEFLKALTVLGDRTPVILMTAFGNIDDAVWAMKLGAVDFLTKPFKRPQLLAAIEAALARVRPLRLATEPQAVGERFFVARSAVMQNLLKQVAQIANTAATVLLHGESGSGKELLARMIHERSSRAHGPFIALNCAAVPEHLIESELFGHEKGSFTGAHSAKEGLFEAAHGGTLLLDEIGDMGLAAQAKLLRVLQESEVRRVGAVSSRKVDVRVVAATHRDLKEAVRQGTFREDLLYRLEVISLRVPPLRERLEDLEPLCAAFLEQACRRHGKTLRGFSQEALALIRAHSWPGNVRELSNCVERAVVFAQGPDILPVDLPTHIQQGGGRLRGAHAPSDGPSAGAVAPWDTPWGSISVRIGTPLREVEDLLIRRTLEATAGDKTMTAKLLGINSRTVYRWLEQEKRSLTAQKDSQDTF